MIELTDHLRESMRAHLAAHDLRTIEPDERKRAAVAIVVVDSDPVDDVDPFGAPAEDMAIIPGGAASLDGQMRNVSGGAAFLLCRRASRMNRHGGQWALPGGRVDGDETPAEAALRELAEEVGLECPEESVLGLLDDYPTRSGFVITPVVVWGGSSCEFRPDPGEVASVHRVPLGELDSPAVPRLRRIPESDRPLISIPLGGTVRTDVHAPTAAVVYQFREVAMHGRSTRVAHYEQPTFAWR